MTRGDMQFGVDFFLSVCVSVSLPLSFFFSFLSVFSFLFSLLYSLMKRLRVKQCKFEMQSIKETASTSSGGNGHQWPLTVESQ